ncbi:hypothetical protein ARGLB_118_00330 [Arthrobacter globiformis NBRC 12137]|uniref:Uncharacterized protein n=1 Tax=Arthrobacter globiformis (strain ATCC 8010 / DSM 20124 / JCM 1332 / NBRC 12137 / NCIMB 8907 / NRRL B-2979 / 168) TaxID=1077972 RepID=H0QU68_ARTG1|nr:hypothetical protein [Arthrobacter globiformis]GAB16369.1 hypothetical protein ARGLB_118_00330 [Arthrobacter globiformis NBRC 12137]
MSDWRRYDSHLIPAFHERFEQRWGKGTAPFLDPEAHEEPLPRAQWINPTTGAALAVVPIWSDDDHRHRTFGVFYLPPAGDIWVLRPGLTHFLEPDAGSSANLVALRNDAFRKAVSHANEFLFGPPPLVD